MKKITILILLFSGIVYTWAGQQGYKQFDWSDNKGVTWSVSVYEDGTDKDVLIYRCSQQEGDIVIPSKVYDGETEYEINGIDLNAFSSQEHITSVTIPESVTDIGDYAFSRCTGLTRINIPDNVTSIGYSVFEECSSLRDITLPSNLVCIYDGAFDQCTSLECIDIPSGVTYIGADAFGMCKSLANVTLPASLKTLGTRAFYGCSSLERIAIPAGLGVIEVSSFEDCSNIKEIAIPSGVYIIRAAAFAGCTSLTEVILPEGLKTIDDASFYGCSNLLHINIPSTIEYLGVDAFWKCPKLSDIDCFREDADLFEQYRENESAGYSFTTAFSNYDAKLHVPYGCTESYKKAYVWKKFKSISAVQSTIPTGLTEINTASAKADGWFTINGIKLNIPPTLKGIYIHGGNKYVIK